ncbi:MAG: hypothetical protein Q7W56_01105 [Candidatus Latescibacteria bacterium]|nr:hypothetical protein [Candidatus Latescibacterota bacterium]
MRRIAMVLAALLGLAGAAVAQSGWEWIGPQFTNTGVIAVDGDGAVFIGGLYMGVRVTEDGGLNWADTGGPGDPTEMVATPDGTVICTDDWGYGLWVTADKGATWNQVIVDNEFENVSQLAVHPLTGDVYAAVTSVGMFYSYDGGYGWDPVASSPVCDQYDDLAIGGNAGIWLKGDTGFFRSNDYCVTWDTLIVPAEAVYGGMLSSAPSFALFMAGYDTTSYESHLLRSWDFGDSWTELAGGLPEGWGEYRGIVYEGDWGTMLLADTSSGVHRSTDMGDTWALYNEDLTSTYVSGIADGPGHVHYLASVSDGVFRRGPGTVAAPGVPATRATLAQNHPNPFNPRTTISFTLAEAGPAELSLYDGRGRLLRTLARGWHEGGTHELQLEAEGLASGSYYCRLVAGGGVQGRALTIVK